MNTITPLEIVLPSFTLGGLREIRFKRQTGKTFHFGWRPFSLIPFLELAVQHIAAPAGGYFHLSVRTTEIAEASFAAVGAQIAWFGDHGQRQLGHPNDSGLFIDEPALSKKFIAEPGLSNLSQRN